METKLNEFECLIVNFKRLIVAYLPFLIISFIIPTVYMFGFPNIISNIICSILFVVILIAWVILTPKVMALSYNAKEIEKNSLLRHRLDKLMKKHDIKKYKLYCWDSSRSKESNAMISGVRNYHLFVSSSLIEEVTLPELETVITHEIGHIKNKHLMKMTVGKLFFISLLVLMALLPYILNFNDSKKILFYMFSILLITISVVLTGKIERKYENQADMYAAGYNDPKLFASALKKITKNEETDKNKLYKLFQSHPDIKDRIEKIKSGQ